MKKLNYPQLFQKTTLQLRQKSIFIRPGLLVMAIGLLHFNKKSPLQNVQFNEMGVKSGMTCLWKLKGYIKKSFIFLKWVKMFT